jgi:hypothetical protein
MSRQASRHRVEQSIAVLVLMAVLVVVLVAGKGSFALRIGLGCAWVLCFFISPWVKKRLGLPKQRVDEAYITSLWRWRHNRPRGRDA